MRDFQKKTPIRSLAIETKIIYTLFLGMNVFAYVLMAVMATQKSGWLPSEGVDYWLGNAKTGAYPKTYGEISELTHFHLFSIPMFMFLQGHIFLMTNWSRRAKIAVLLGAFFPTACYIASPWAVIFLSEKLAILGSIGKTGMAAALGLFFWIPTKQMWTKD